MVINGSKLKRWKLFFNKTKSSSKPVDEFICPVSGLLMFDPVVVSSGQTFERISVQVCQELNIIPVLPDGCKPDFSTVIPNLTLKKAINNWCLCSGASVPRCSPDYSLVEASVRKLINGCGNNISGGESGFKVSDKDMLVRGKSVSGSFKVSDKDMLVRGKSGFKDSGSTDMMVGGESGFFKVSDKDMVRGKSGSGSFKVLDKDMLVRGKSGFKVSDSTDVMVRGESGSFKVSDKDMLVRGESGSFKVSDKDTDMLVRGETGSFKVSDKDMLVRGESGSFKVSGTDMLVRGESGSFKVSGTDMMVAGESGSFEVSGMDMMVGGESGFKVTERELLEGVTERGKVMLKHAETEVNRRCVERFYSSSSEESVIANVPDTPPLRLVTRPSCYFSSSDSTSSDIVVDETITVSPDISISDEQKLLTKLVSLDVFEQEQTVIMLRKITRSDEEARVSLCTPRMLAALRECVVSRYAVVQTNAVAALVNLSLETENKLKIVRSGIVPHLIDVLKSGFDESQEHAAGALFSLALEEENKTAIGVLGALQPLLHALHSDSVRTRNDSALALYHLSLVQSNRVKLVKLGAVSTLLTMLETGLAGRVILVLCNLAASNEGKSALLDSNAVECLFRKLRAENAHSSESTRENCVACLYSLSLGSMRFKGLARVAGGAEVLREVEEKGSERARDRAKRMLVMLRDRDDGEVGRDWEALLGGTSQTRYGGNSTAF